MMVRDGGIRVRGRGNSKLLLGKSMKREWWFYGSTGRRMMCSHWSLVYVHDRQSSVIEPENKSQGCRKKLWIFSASFNMAEGIAGSNHQRKPEHME